MGGADIGVLLGLVLGAAAESLPVVADGFISTAAAALVVAFCPPARDYLFCAHRSVEPGRVALLEFIGHAPLLDLQMRLGEGTGAALAMYLIEAAAKLLGEMATFAEAGVSGGWRRGAIVAAAEPAGYDGQTDKVASLLQSRRSKTCFITSSASSVCYSLPH